MGRGSWFADRTAKGQTLLQKALRDLHKSDYYRLHCKAVGVVGSPEIADDVVQEAFANTAAAISRGTDIKDLERWLSRCVHNTAVSFVERNRISRSLHDDFDLIDFNSLPETVYARHSDNKDVCDAIEKLPTDQRSAFLMAELKGLKHSEIAVVLERSENSVRQLLCRARRNIRELVGPNVPSIATPALERHYQNIKIHAGAARDTLAAKLARLQEVVASIVHRSSELGVQSAIALLTGAAVVTVLGTAPVDEKQMPPASVPSARSIQPVVSYEKSKVVSGVKVLPTLSSTDVDGNSITRGKAGSRPGVTLPDRADVLNDSPVKGRTSEAPQDSEPGGGNGDIIRPRQRSDDPCSDPSGISSECQSSDDETETALSEYAPDSMLMRNPINSLRRTLPGSNEPNEGTTPNGSREGQDDGNQRQDDEQNQDQGAGVDHSQRQPSPSSLSRNP